MPDGRSITGAVTCPPLAISLMCASRSKPLSKATAYIAPLSPFHDPSWPSLDHRCNPSACPGLPCDGSSDCHGGACICGDAFGTTCGGGASVLSPPPPPDYPPAAPGGGYVSLVTFSLTVAGDVSSFDEADFKSKLATFLGVEMSEMSIQVSSASVKVDVSITTAETAKASAVETKVTQSTPAVFSSALDGYTVTDVGEVTNSRVLPSPPPPSDTSGQLGLIIGVVAGVVGVLLAIGLLWLCFCQRSGKRRAAVRPDALPA